MKLKQIYKFFIHLLLVILFTIITQIGGLLYLISILVISRKKKPNKLKKAIIFSLLYLLSTFLIVPNLAPLLGREKIINNNNLKAHSLFTILCNRNYVKPELNKVLTDISKTLKTKYPKLKLVYLDANFPFLDNFPLLPHLSHNDGKKIDISFIYKDINNQITNKKPTLSGYGFFSKPIDKEINQTEVCKNKNYWQYDYSKYLTFGTINKHLKISKTKTRLIILEILKHKNVSKLFIEPHLKKRLLLNNSRIRFHGCRAVRHDDHIHFQIN